MLRGIESVTDAFGYQTMLAHYGYKPELEEERLESMLSWNIDGLILTERTHTPRTLKMIIKTRTQVGDMTMTARDDRRRHLPRRFEVVKTHGNIKARRLAVHQFHHRDPGHFDHLQRTGGVSQTEGIRAGDA